MKSMKSLYIAFVPILLMLAMQAYAAPTAATIRPIEDFLDRQGTFCIDVNFNTSYEDEIVDGNFVGDLDGNCETGAPPLLFVPPIANFLGWGDPDSLLSSSVDYAGLADYWAGGAFGTTFAGQVIERPLEDGRALVLVRLRTKNALTWIVNLFDFTGDLLFGYRAPDVVEEGAEPALGSADFKVKFINTALGADLPDLLQLKFFPEEDQELISENFTNQAKGSLPDGTPARTKGKQVGLFVNPNSGTGSDQCVADNPSAIADCYPVEKIVVQEIGN